MLMKLTRNIRVVPRIYSNSLHLVFAVTIVEHQAGSRL